MTEGDFREDLFYRLNVFPLTIRPLRDRPEDILPLAQRLLSTYGADSTDVDFSDSAIEVLQSHSWPGNVRELDNVIQRALILKNGKHIEAKDIHFEQTTDFSMNATEVCTPEAPTKPSEDSLNSDLRVHEKNLIISALKTKNNRREVAQSLGISPRTLRYKLARLRDAGVAIPA